MKETKKYGYIDALRGYAVLLVIFGHVTQLMSFQGILASLFQKTALGVQLFYVVSALTLTMSWHSKQDGVFNFFIRRIFRIGPLFWLAIVFYLTLYGFGERSAAPNGISWTDVALTATFTHMLNPNSINSVVPGGWSVAVEMSFYLIFPLWMLMVRGWKSAAILVVGSYYLGKYASALLGQIYANHSYPEYLIQVWKEYILPSQISAFAIGVCLYFVINRLSHITGKVFSYSAFVAAVFAITCNFFILQYGGPIAVLTYSMIFALFALSLRTGHLSIVTNKWIQKLGVLSFSAYLLQFSVIYLLKSYGIVDYLISYGQSIALPILSILVVAITVVASYFTHRFIETPGIQAGNSLIQYFHRRTQFGYRT
ncbi:MAG TPA: acyltransferase [Herbaspirillum sp.]|jgi:peptidoglycan/LPS O-acetylase OafA/YrhL